ncbi:MAG: 30S ribosomal protein S16 [Chloroflexi bacterium]|nr:30S ribosomal protein S16 [Chloroflexota bacterium]
MVRIRLRRTGSKKQASYRVVVADQRAPRDGRFIENLGYYNPRTDPPTVEINRERLKYWLSKGAQPSDAVAQLLRNIDLDAPEEEIAEASTEEAIEAQAEAA